MNNKKPNKKYEEKIEILDQWDYLVDDYLDRYVPAFSRLVGEFMMRFSVIEHDLNVAISEAINPRGHDVGLSVVGTLALRNKVNLFQKLYLPIVSTNNKKQHPSVTQKVVLKNICQELDDLINFRNRVAHANWAAIDKEGYVRSKVIADDNGFVQFVRFKVSITLFRERLRQIHSLDLDINEFYKIALEL